MSWTFRMLLVATVGVIPTGLAWAQIEKKPKSVDLPKDYRWEEVARANKLKDKDIQLLRQNKFVITGPSYKQVFTPYLSSRWLPIFFRRRPCSTTGRFWAARVMPLSKPRKSGACSR